MAFDIADRTARADELNSLDASNPDNTARIAELEDEIAEFVRKEKEANDERARIA